tara:strand:+ start:263 stop:493 length:231 start_codon:yes stop_codon:yes gene_type:complete
MPFSGELGNGIAVKLHLHHACLLPIIQMGFITIWQLDRCKDAVIKRYCKDILIFAFNMTKQAGGGPFEDALHPTFW